MIYAMVQIASLLYSSFLLMRFHAKAQKCRYRPFISFLATVWLAACMTFVFAIVISWPEAVSKSNLFTAGTAVGSAYLAWWCHGNVANLVRKGASLLRKLDRLVN